MSTAEVVNSTRNQMFTDYDLSKILLGNNSFITGIIQADGADVVVEVGTIMGRVTATSRIVPLAPSAIDGSEIPVGIQLTDQTVLNGSLGNTTLANKGKVNENLLIVPGGGGLDIEIDNKTLRDWLNYLGLALELADEMTDWDNS